MPKLDLKKEFKYLYAPSAKEVVLVDVAEMGYLMVDGVGDPNTSQEYMDSIEVLYSISYTLKFMLKKSAAVLDYGVMPLEGPTIERIHAFIDEHGYKRRGKHHEIYLSDPRRTAPEKLKTVIRQPVE
ncbi:MAG: GyrI-like domain-containing protein [Candidatus Aquicultor sp.]|nr:GyrI-like domain-containing protein [Candidatus Aquicultor sp.]